MVKKRLNRVFILYIFVLFLLASCTQENTKEHLPVQEHEEEQISSQKNEFADVIPGYEDLIKSGNPFEFAIVPEKNIVWIYFSSIDYQEERELIKVYEKKAFESISSSSEPAVFISIYDLNNDGQDEIIAFLQGASIWEGSRSTGYLVVYFVDHGVISKSIPLPSLLIDASVLDDSRQVGVIKRTEGMSDLLLLNRLCIWNGEYWG